MGGGAYLCYEGFEKLAHRLLHSQAEDAAHHADLVRAVADSAIDLVAVERHKIKGAVRTDFILSAEIIVITLGTVAAAPFMTRLSVLAGVALLMTVGVYGLVAGIVKLDDGGRYLSRRTGDTGSARLLRGLGTAILGVAPSLMKGLSVAGTAAMFLVGGSILVHGVPLAHDWVARLAEGTADLPGVGRALRWLVPVLLDALAGIAAGALALAVVSGARRLLRPRAASRDERLAARDAGQP
jgi:predicted DNA repair protein MutK